jgi:pimeloyl-ACP methyl ester carboxylesterase
MSRYSVCSRRRVESGLAIALLVALAVPLVGTRPAMAQAAKKAEPAAKKVAVKKKDVPKPPKSRDVHLKTRDELQLTVTYYPSLLQKDAVPIVLLHDYKGNRQQRPYEETADKYQALGYAVLVPDLRGHGESINFAKTAGAATRPALRLKALKPADFTKMVHQDMRTVKSFLMKENNAGKLNIEKLCLIGTGMGASVAANFATFDWSHQQFAGAKKQGRDVRGLVMVSPNYSFRGLPLTYFLAHRNLPQELKMMHEQLSIMMIVGKQNTGHYADAKRIFKKLSLQHVGKEAENLKQRSLFFSNWQHDTPLQGIDLLTAPSLKVADDVGFFIKRKLGESPHAWTDRTSKLKKRT